jgi:hypothetical protein
MKKRINLIAVFGFLAVVLLMTVSACKKDASPGNTDIVGKWAQSQFQGTLGYEFKSDHTFKYYILATDSVTKKTLGYRSKTEGKYSIKNDSLKLFAMVTYATPGGSFTTEDKLQKINAADKTDYRFSFNDKKDRLSVFFKCPFNADCVPSPIVYNKQ